MTRSLLLLLAFLGCQPGSPPGEPTATAAASASAAPSAAPSATLFTSKERFELIIAGATVVDGSGSKPYVGDVLVDHGRIVHVGRVAHEVNAARRIEAHGMVVAPGFIDAH